MRFFVKFAFAIVASNFLAVADEGRQQGRSFLRAGRLFARPSLFGMAMDLFGARRERRFGSLAWRPEKLMGPAAAINLAQSCPESRLAIVSSSCWAGREAQHPPDMLLCAHLQ